MGNKASTSVQPLTVRTINVGERDEQTQDGTNPGDTNDPNPDLNPEFEYKDTPFTETELYKAMTPLIFHMRIFGQYFHKASINQSRDRKNRHADDGVSPLRTRKFSLPARTYATLVLVILWLNLARMMSVFANKELQLGTIFFSKLLAMMYMVLCTMNCTTLYLACHRASWERFFEQWRSLEIYNRETSLKYVRHHAWIFLFGAVLLNTVNTGFTGYGMYHNELFDITVTPFEVTDPNVNFYRAIYILLHWFMGCAWTLGLVLHFLVCLVLRKEFVYVNKNLCKDITRQRYKRIFTGDIETIRQWHQDVCLLVDKADEVFAIQTGVTFATSVTVILLVVYMMIFYHGILADPLLATINFVWLAAAITSLLLTCIYGAIVNHVVGRLVKIASWVILIFKRSNTIVGCSSYF